MLALALDQGRTVRHPFTGRMLAARVDSERALIRRLRSRAVVIGVTPSQFISARAERVPLVFVRPFAYSLAHTRAARQVGATELLPRTTAGGRLIDGIAAHLLDAAGRMIPLPWAFHRVGRATAWLCPTVCSPG